MTVRATALVCTAVGIALIAAAVGHWLDHSLTQALAGIGSAR